MRHVRQAQPWRTVCYHSRKKKKLPCAPCAPAHRAAHPPLLAPGGKVRHVRHVRRLRARRTWPPMYSVSETYMGRSSEPSGVFGGWLASENDGKWWLRARQTKEPRRKNRLAHFRQERKLGCAGCPVDTWRTCENGGFTRFRAPARQGEALAHPRVGHLWVYQAATLRPMFHWSEQDDARVRRA